MFSTNDDNQTPNHTQVGQNVTGAQSKTDRCPNCGHCPHCGQSQRQFVYPGYSSYPTTYPNIIYTSVPVTSVATGTYQDRLHNGM